ncbi:MAG: GTP 3',8-cyclase MoaA [Planctomycetota bacterium]
MKPLALPVMPAVMAKVMGLDKDSGLRDSVGRGFGYLRLSLTRGCSMRCTYCRPDTDDNPRGEQRLSPQEIEQLVCHLAQHHGLKKVRLTGGDPTSRPELVDIIQRVASVPGISDLAMTTNGLTLERMAMRYKQAGLARVNVSLDTLDSERFRTITGVDGLERVLRGIDAAISAGLSPVKINTVVVRGQNDEGLPDLVRFAAGRGLEVRFIELMPMGPLSRNWHERYVTAQETRDRLSKTMRFSGPMPQGRDAARRYRVELADEQKVTVGFITPMSCNFCADCNRIRLAADGRVYPCLMDRPAGSLLPALRPRFDGSRVDTILKAALTQKQAEHPMFGQAVMTAIGG